MVYLYIAWFQFGNSARRMKLKCSRECHCMALTYSVRAQLFLRWNGGHIVRSGWKEFISGGTLFFLSQTNILLEESSVRAVKPFLSQESVRMVYFSYFHSIMTYRLVFWGNSYHSNTVIKLQKRIIRIVVGIRDRESCREHFRN
jgi:hypothetical protein